MTSASRGLLDLVLQRIEQHPIGSLDDVDVAAFGRGALDPLLERRILVQQRTLDELEGCPVQWIGPRPFLFDLDNERPPQELDPRLLIRYEIDLSALCWAVRRANQLAGPPVEELSDLAYFIGHCGSGRQRRSLCLVRRLREHRVPDTIVLLRGRIGGGQLVLLTPRPIELRRSTLRSASAEQTVISSVSEALDPVSPDPFALSIPMVIRADIDDRTSVRLALDSDSRMATLDNREIDLTPREFDVLLALANEARDGVGYMPRENLLEIIEAHRRIDRRHRTDDPTAAPQDLENAISRIRRALAAAAGLPSEEGRRLIQSRRGGGYRLGLAGLGLERNDVAIF